MKKVIILISCFILLTSTVLTGLNCNNGDDGETKETWRLIVYTQPNDLVTEIHQDFANLIEERSDGRIEVKVFSAGSLYTLSESFNAVSMGSVDIAFFPRLMFLGQIPKSASMTYYANVMGVRDPYEVIAVSKVLEEEHTSYKEEDAANDIMSLMWLALNSANYYFKEPVRTIEDMSNLKIGANPAMSAQIEAFGAIPVPLDVNDYYMSVETGLVDALGPLPMDIYLSFGLSEVLPYVLEIRTATTITSTQVNRSSFENLPKDLQEVVLEVALEIETQGNEALIAHYQAIVQQLKDDPNVDFYSLPMDESERWRTTSILPNINAILESNLSADEITQMHEIIDRVREEYEADK